MSDARAERWREADRLCNQALALDRGARAAFLQETCVGDEDLRLEVTALLECNDEADAFLELPAVHVLARSIADEATSLVGRQVAQYHVESLVGAGGMGEVYRAHDLKLERDVALKVVERSLVAMAEDFGRFEDEARTASRLNHPNIVTIYGVGEADGVAYIAMELVQGRTLRDVQADGRLKLEMAIAIAVQLADALAAAHDAGIVHRDLKPENVMVTPEGRVKVLDFGIARRHQTIDPGARWPAGGSARPRSTESGVILGTIGYMSPEQAAGRAVDYRSDQFSFGTILYELVSGGRAFDRPTRDDTIAAIIGEDPPPIPAGDRPMPDLNQVLTRCLAKDPQARYSSTRDLATELHAIQHELLHNVGGAWSRRRAMWLMAGTAIGGAIGITTWEFWPGGPRVRRLAVLPFANAADDVDAEYLCDGLADSLIRRLSLVRGIEVKALSAALHFKGSTLDPRAIGQQLNADAVLTGTLTRRAGRLIVSAELVDVARATRLWGDVLDRPESDVLAVHDEIAAAIIRDGIGAQGDHEGERRFRRGSTTNPQAYDLYLQAVHYFRLEDEDSYLTARELLQKAVTRDQSFALAHVLLASTYSAMAIDGYESPHIAWPQSTQSIARALSLDAELPDAHAEASAAAFYYRWDWQAADREWQVALDSRRGEVQAELLDSRMLQTWALGRNAEALQFAHAARLADPLSPICVLREADLLAVTGEYDAAASLYDKIIRDAPGDLRAYFGLADVRRAQGRYDDAIEVRRRAGTAAGDDSLRDIQVRGAAGYAQIERGDARRQLEGLGARATTGAYVSPLDLARVHARLGDRERAFEHLAAAFTDRSAGLVFLRVDPSWTQIRDDLRFRQAVRQVGLPNAA